MFDITMCMQLFIVISTQLCSVAAILMWTAVHQSVSGVPTICMFWKHNLRQSPLFFLIFLADLWFHGTHFNWKFSGTMFDHHLRRKFSRFIILPTAIHPPFGTRRHLRCCQGHWAIYSEGMLTSYRNHSRNRRARAAEIGRFSEGGRWG